MVRFLLTVSRALFVPIAAPLRYARHRSPLSTSLQSAGTGAGYPTMKGAASGGESSPRKELQLLSKSRDAFVEWAVQNAIPISCTQPIPAGEDDGGDQNDPFLSYLGDAVERSSASVVLLSEGFHNCREMMSLHHRVVRHLCARRGFRVVATESGMPESRDVADYVAASSDREYSAAEAEAVWTKGLNKMYSAWIEGRELVEWMREHNRKNLQRSAPMQRHPQEMISYCGLDIGGFYSDWTYPMSKITNYMKGKFPEFEAEWSRKIGPILDIMGTVQARHNYQHLLTPSQKSTLALLLDELVAKFNSRGDELDGDFEFEWAKQSAISVGVGCFIPMEYARGTSLFLISLIHSICLDATC